MFSISFRKHRDEEKENNLLTLIIKIYNPPINFWVLLLATLRHVV